MKKICSTCGESFETENHGRTCRLCGNAKQRLRRSAQKNSVTRRYEKTPQGFLMRAYRNMQSRVTGVQWRKSHLYAGKCLLSRAEFYAWAEDSQDFANLYAAWVLSGYARKLTPSVDRRDATKGYELDNMRWLTHSENSGQTSRRKEKAANLLVT